MPTAVAARRTVIRPGAEADLGALVRLLADLFSIEADFRPDARRQRRGLALMLEDSERRVVLVAERSSRVVGMVTVQLVVSTAEGAPSGWVEDMVVEPAERRRGLGRRLLVAAERWATARGAPRLQLLADAGNAPALAFYERMGWGGTQLVCLRRGGSLGSRRAAGGRRLRRR
jgi:GNAT superfamily N-acetyltransferase